MPTDDLITYEETNKVLLTVPEAFEKRRDTVVALVWKPGIDVGKTISPGTVLADVCWGNRPDEVITAPANCSGEISSVHRDIIFENLPYAPPQWLLRIS